MELSTAIWIFLVGVSTCLYVWTANWFLILANSRSVMYQWGWIGLITATGIYIGSLFFLIPQLRHLVQAFLNNLSDRE